MDGNLELTQDQQAAAARLRKFFGDPTKRCFILKGYAGTGKTLLTGWLAQELMADKRTVALMAPTGRAARVLRRKTGLLAATVHRYIYNLRNLAADEDMKTWGSFKFFFRLRDTASDNLDQVVFVDEASMVSDCSSEGEFLRFGSGRLLKDVFEYMRLGDPKQKSKVVMVGDPAQLPPVETPFSPALDAAYLASEHGVAAEEYELTEVVRQEADSPILREATAIRRTLASGFLNRLSIRPDPPRIEAVPADDLPMRFVEENQSSGLPRTICVAHANATCLNLNVAIRSRMLGGDGMQSPQAGDALVAIRNNSSTGLLNGDAAIVLKADTECERIRVPVGKEQAELAFRNVTLLAESDNGDPLEIESKIVENALFSEKRDISPLEQKALFIYFRMRHRDLKPNTKAFTEALLDDPYFNALQVKFGYAITCHKAQGGEWDDVFIHFDRPGTHAEALRWAYTALTRARQRVFGVNLPDRRPWTGARPLSGFPAPPVESVETSGDKLEAAGSTASALPVGPTRWDALFPEEPDFVLGLHQAMTAALESEGVTILDVEARIAGYYWRYDVAKDERRACLRVNFRRNGTVNLQALPVAGADPKLGDELLTVLRAVPKAARAKPGALTFPEDKPFLREFYEARALPRAQTAGIAIVRVDHCDYLEKYHLAQGSDEAVLRVHYSDRGTITRMIRESGNAGLCRAIADGNA
jgi:hypothetical protein